MLKKTLASSSTNKKRTSQGKKETTTLKTSKDSRSPKEKAVANGVQSPSSGYIATYMKDFNMSANRLAKYKSFLKRIRANKIKKFFKQNLVKTYYTHEKRIKYYQYIVKHLAPLNTKACVESKQIVTNGKTVFNGYSIQDKIYLDKQIGSASKYGVIYKTFIKGTFGGAPIATKIMKALKSNKKEIDITILTSDKLAQNQLSRHFLFTYKYFQCFHKVASATATTGTAASGPDGTTTIEAIIKSNYFISLNEMAHGDLKMLCHDTKILEDNELLLNLSCQCMIALASFHNLDYLHRDAHWGNFLYHKTQDDKSKKLQLYHYIICGKDYYLPACGYTIMLHDFGKALHIPTEKQALLGRNTREIDADRYIIEKSISDYTRILHAFMSQDAGGWSIYDYLPDDEVCDMIEQLYYGLISSTRTFVKIGEIIEYIIQQYTHIGVISDVLLTGSDIINKEPFVI
jgi:hypothetical protein